MTSITIGKTEEGKDLTVELAKLAETRLLIQAGSGGGKSYLIRKLLEESHGKIQQIVLDVEGDFASLREKYDYILAAAKGADVVANVKTAELLARKVLELEASIIIDLYELKHHERIRFVKLFLDAMTNAPKELWHPCLVIIDEAHIFAPEKGESEAMGSVIDLATRGRKRGYCAVLATQRLSKMHKDAAAECQNKLIGMTALDIDRKRASEELGFTTKELTLSLRDLDPGQFYAFGPAISRIIQQVRVGEVKTSHPKAGQRLVTKAVPVPTTKIQGMLAKLTDLPQEAETEIKTKQSLEAENARLKAELRRKEMAGSQQPVRVVQTPPSTEQLKETYNEGYSKGWHDCWSEWNKFIAAMPSDLDKVCDKINQLAGIRVTLANLAEAIRNKMPLTAPPLPAAPKIRTAAMRPAPAVTNRSLPTTQVTLDGDQNFGRAERLILKFLAVRAGKSFNKPQIGAMTGYSPNGGGFNNSLSKLKTAGLIVMSGGNYGINNDALEQVIGILGSEYSAPEQDALEQWLEKLGKAAKSIYKVLLDSLGQSFSKEELGQFTNYAPDGGGFNNAISQLCTLGLAERTGDGRVQLNQELLQV